MVPLYIISSPQTEVPEKSKLLPFLSPANLQTLFEELESTKITNNNFEELEIRFFNRKYLYSSLIYSLNSVFFRNPRKMEVNWSELPPELLEMIARKLKIYLDYIRFRAVCVKWNSSTSPTPHHLPTQFPWLMLPFGSPNGAQRSFFDISENKLHLLNLLETRQSRCCGSSQGWLVLVEELSPVIRLLNPLTRIQFRLPPVTTFPNVLDFNFFKLGKEYLLQGSSDNDRYRRDMKTMRDRFIKKIILSSSPNSVDYIALAILNETGDLAFCKKGFEEWSIIDDVQSFCEDVIYYNGAFYAVNEDGAIAICDLSGVVPVVTVITPQVMLGHDIGYLVNSFGELLLVTRYLGTVYGRESDVHYETIGFGVYKFDSSKLEWVKMESLGNYVLFVGENSSVCLSADDYSGCQRNCIYFTCESAYGEDGGDLGVYYLDDCSIVPLAYAHFTSQFNRSQHFLRPPIWITPNPC